MTHSLHAARVRCAVYPVLLIVYRPLLSRQNGTATAAAVSFSTNKPVAVFSPPPGYIVIGGVFVGPSVRLLQLLQTLANCKSDLCAVRHRCLASA